MKWFDKLQTWRDKHLTEQQLVLILAFLTGLGGAVAALILKWLIHSFQHLLTFSFIDGANFLYLLWPAVGILIAGLYVRYILKDDISHGVTKILYAISQRKSIIKLHNIYSSVLASSITIGFGGSVGAEAPIVLTGSAIGSNLGRKFRLDQHTMMILLGCGATAGIAGIFKAPIAGLLFTIEVLMLDLTAFSIMPLLIASVTAASVAYAVDGPTAMFSFSDVMDFNVERIPFVILLGVVCGFVSLYFTRTTFLAEDWFRRIRNPWKKWMFGALFLSISIFLLPPLYGEGYGSIQHLYDGNTIEITDNSIFYDLVAFTGSDGIPHTQFLVLCVFIVLIMLTKSFATAATNAGGGVGGTFAPSLFLGNFAGFLFAFVLNYAGCFTFLPTPNFAVMGMAAVMSGVMHAPLMGVFLSAELTGRFDLFLPLMIASCISYGTIRIFEPYSIYTRRLAQKGELITHHKDKAVLTMLHLEDFVESDYQVVPPSMLLGDLVKLVSQARHNTFPVCEADGHFLGIVTLDDIRNIMFQPRLYERMKVEDIMIGPLARIRPEMNMAEVMNLFDNTNAWSLPLIDQSGRYLGMLSKSHIFRNYRALLKSFCED
ncbi:MAG: chloride channel protein [Bacteroidales bacterium]|nr:chloride channel protein [Bacteroidales bacterium]MBP5764991.1 chloride channel protein [Bacteroidales bacterium]